MCRELFHIWGPISVNSYGAMMLIGLIVVIVLMQSDPLVKKIMNREQLFNAAAVGILSGILGARFLYVICNWNAILSFRDVFALWDGGLSMMGGVIGILVVLPFYLRKKGTPTILFFDLFAFYAPLLHAFTRIGCFLAGCCYGKPTTMVWGVSYTNGELPFDYAVHPTQIYTFLMQLFIFGILIFFRKNFYKKQGQLVALYLILAGLERFIVDFWRGDREFFPQDFLGLLSIHQLLSLIISGLGLLLFLTVSQRKMNFDEYI